MLIFGGQNEGHRK
ncbi:hypothetical protein U9M48_036461 [Paspalum notatum var. saurae]|uniref:Uncharacterized protein n=1 Tax=Paspalum notatum var. saurae TaxID=547442 RepID=A0AAQ3XA39_PASNO